MIRVPLKIYPSLQANAPIEITNVVFANYSNSGQVLNDYTSALPGGVQFLTPKLTLSTKHVGIITVNITFNSWAGTTMKHSCNILLMVLESMNVLVMVMLMVRAIKMVVIGL